MAWRKNMEKKRSSAFQFGNNIAPRYIESLFILLQYDRWYGKKQMIDVLRASGLNVEGGNIVSYNALAWSLIGLGEVEKMKVGRSARNMFRLTRLGKQLIDTYSTNSELFYDLIHFLFYSTYRRSSDVKNNRLWLYPKACDTLWEASPFIIDTLSLTNQLQIEFRGMFPEYDPAFNDRSVGGVFPWLQTLSPPFLSRAKSNKSLLYSDRRSTCTPQLFHLATDMIYNIMEGVQYGSSLAINEQQIEDICKVCLLDPERFWNMANLTEMTVNGYEVHQGQWGTSISLAGPPNWITLPDFSNEQPAENEDVFEHGGEE
jgi:hypothetical protein